MNDDSLILRLDDMLESPFDAVVKIIDPNVSRSQADQIRAAFRKRVSALYHLSDDDACEVVVLSPHFIKNLYGLSLSRKLIIEDSAPAKIIDFCSLRNQGIGPADSTPSSRAHDQTKDDIHIRIHEEPSGFGLTEKFADSGVPRKGSIVDIRPVFFFSGLKNIPLATVTWDRGKDLGLTLFMNDNQAADFYYRLFNELTSPTSLSLLEQRLHSYQKNRSLFVDKLAKKMRTATVETVSNLWITIDFCDKFEGNSTIERVDSEKNENIKISEFSRDSVLTENSLPHRAKLFAARFGQINFEQEKSDHEIADQSDQVATKFFFRLGPKEVLSRLVQIFDLQSEFDESGANQTRLAEVQRKTKETEIALTVNLDSSTPITIDTGVGFWDHMLEQIAKHGGFSLQLSCVGDLHVDGHHTIEDTAIALGEAIRSALGNKAGIARFGFTLPMDETRAEALIDLSGRPFLQFEGSFDSELLHEYPTQMTEHVFRSIADSLAASIHIRVDGKNDHHKTEACFKAFGRVLRMAIKKESKDVTDIPSTKGVLS